MHLSLLDFVVIVLYASAVLAISAFVSNEECPRGKAGKDYALERRALPWWAIGASLIAANISAEQIIGMSGSAYAFGLAIASYEWMGAATLLLVGKYLLPIFLRYRVRTLPEFLRQRFGARLQLVMAMLWIGIYVFVVLTAILWLGATAVHAVTGLTMGVSLVLLGLFAGNYALYVGLKAASYTDLIQVAMLVAGGLAIAYFALVHIAGGGGLSGVAQGFAILTARVPDHFHMILSPANPYYKYVPGLSVLFGGMWIINLSYWGFNQYIVQRALTAKDIRDVQNGVVFAAALKLLIPVLVVLPGVAAVLLVPHLSRPDEAYPKLMTLLPSGLLGLVFVALVAAIIASMRSTLSSIATIFVADIFQVVNCRASLRQGVIAGRMAAIIALGIAMAAAMPLLHGFDQAFQYIQEFNGFFTPGVVAVCLLGLLWQRTTEAGALVAAIGSPLLSTGFTVFLPAVPFMNRMLYVFLIVLVSAVAVSQMQKRRPQASVIDVNIIDFSTGAVFNIGAFAVVAILAALYAAWW